MQTHANCKEHLKTLLSKIKLKFKNQDFFYSGDESKSFHTERLLLVGVLLCSGNLYERAEVLCRIASKGDQNFVKNRDFWPIFVELVHICINLTVD